MMENGIPKRPGLGSLKMEKKRFSQYFMKISKTTAGLLSFSCCYVKERRFSFKPSVNCYPGSPFFFFFLNDTVET